MRRWRARYYNSKLGLWLSVDPAGSLLPGVSPYNYVQNNPLIRIDPNGMWDYRSNDEIFADGMRDAGGGNSSSSGDEEKNKQENQSEVITASVGIGGSLGVLAAGHLEFNIGFAYDKSNFLNSRFMLNVQTTPMFGAGVVGNIMIQSGISYNSSASLEAGATSQAISHSEFGLGLGAAWGGSVDVPLEGNNSGGGFSFGILGKWGVGVAAYGGTDVGWSGTLVTPRAIDMLRSYYLFGGR